MHPMTRRTGLVLVALCLPLVLETCKSSESPGVPTTIVISPASFIFGALGRTQRFTAVVKDQRGTAMTGAKVTWSSTNGAVVTVVDTSGVATPVANGSAQLTATSGSATQNAGVTVGQVAAAIAKVSGDAQTGTVGQALASPLVVQVSDSTAHAIAGLTVNFAVTSGAGSLGTAAPTTGANGQAQTTWTLGGAAGSQTVSATASGSNVAGNPVTFTATATGTAVVAWVGNHQPGLVGYGVNVRPAVRLTDPSNSPIANATVTFAVTGGGGSVTGGTATTNANGVAQAGKWTLGASPGVNTLTATVTGSGIIGNPVAFSDTGVAAQFTIQLQYFGGFSPTPAESAAFNAAIAKYEQVIYRHYGPAVPVTDTAGTCGAKEPAVNATITDVLILASFDAIDGPGKTLAEAGPCFLRTANSQALVGIMKIDTADVGSLISSGQLNEVVLHEMNHVLGFGTVWNLPSPFLNYNCLQLASNPPGTLLDTYFHCISGGVNAAAVFDSIGGTSYTGAGQTVGGHIVPLENCANAPVTYPTCAGGTVNSHWRETVFGNELMTGFINSGTNPLSVLSVAAQQDIGYTVNYDGADAYSAVFTAPVAGGAAPRAMGDDIHHGPMYFVDAAGRVKAVIRR